MLDNIEVFTQSSIRIKDETRARLPYYGTSMGHIASQKVAIGSGFVPAWAELVTDRLE